MRNYLLPAIVAYLLLFTGKGGWKIADYLDEGNVWKVSLNAHTEVYFYRDPAAYDAVNHVGQEIGVVVSPTSDYGSYYIIPIGSKEGFLFNVLTGKGEPIFIA